MDIQNLFDFGRWTFLTGTLSLVLGFGFILHGCGKTGTMEQKEVMAMAKASSTPHREIPPIDRYGSLETETATFALG